MVKFISKLVSLLCILSMIFVTAVYAQTRYEESFSAANDNCSEGWTFNKTDADYAGALTNHLKIEKTSADNGYVEVSRTTSSAGLGFTQQVNLEFDFYVSGAGQNTKILLPISSNAFFILGINIRDDGIYTTSYTGNSLDTRLCGVMLDKLYTLKIESLKNNTKAKLSISSEGETVYSNDNLNLAASYGSFVKVIYRVEGANTSFNLKRFALDGRYDNYSTKFDYFEKNDIPSSYTVTANNVGNAVIEQDPVFARESLGIALISGGGAVSAAKDLNDSAVKGNYLLFETTFKASVDTTGTEIYLQSGDEAGSASDYLAYLRILRAKSGEDTALTLQNCVNGTYTNLKTGITDLGKDHVLMLSMDLVKGLFNVNLDGMAVAENCKFYSNNIPTNRNVKYITYKAASSAGNSFVVKKHSVKATYGTSDGGIVLSGLGYYDAAGGEITRLKEGQITVKAVFSEVADVENLYLVMCYYNNNSLENISISKGSLSAAEKTKELLCSIDCDNVGNESVLKLYIWQDIDNARFLYRDTYELR